MAKREEQKENPSKYNISRTTIIFIVFSVTGRIDYLASFMYIYIYPNGPATLPPGKIKYLAALSPASLPCGVEYRS